MNQTVLLRGVNDDLDTMLALNEGLLRLGVKPYYLHHGDLAAGTAHLRSTVARGRAILRAMCGRTTIAEVEHLVEPGELDPNDVDTPGVYVQRVVALTPEQAADKRIEKVTTRPRPSSADEALVDDAATHGLGG